MDLFPKSLKRAKILSILKNKDELDIGNKLPSNFYPTYPSVKFMKRSFLIDSITISVNSLLSSSLFGFTSGANIEHAIFKCPDDILKL